MIADAIVGRVLEDVLAGFRTSWHSYKLLFAPVIGEQLRMRVGKLRARAVAWSARRDVPAYRLLVEEHGIRPGMRFEDLPIMDKPGYVHRFPLAAICRGGVLPMRGGVIDESSGSSGAANNWVRGPAERRATRTQIQHAARATFGDRDFIVLNAFALGPWATGMTVSAALGERYLVKSIGPDLEKLVATLELFGTERPYLVCGYPPFLKLLADRGLASRYELYAVVGGEGMSEPLRASLERCFTRVISSFGASDLEINIAAENDATIAIRRALLDRPAFARELLGTSQLPMVFQFDPLDYFLETIEDDLVVTVNRLACVSPRIRYNLRDRARVLTRAHVTTVAADHGIALPRSLPLPLLFHWGRVDHAVAYYGCKLTPEDLQHALLRMPALEVIEYALHPYEDAGANKQLELWVETRNAVEVTPALEAELVRRLAEVNQDFRESIRMIPSPPRLRIWAAGQSPMSNQDHRIKKRYIL